MKRIIILLVSLFFWTIISGQTKIRRLEDFSSLKVSGSFEVRLVQGEKNEAIISIPASREEDIVNVKTVVDNGVLSIYRKGKIKSKKNMVIVLTFKELKGVDLRGASEIVTLDTVKSERFLLTGSGAIEANFNLDVKRLIVNFSGVSNIKLKGIAENFMITTSGASNVKAVDLMADTVIVDVSGASDIKVHATKSIRGNATGASSVTISGNPTIRAINSEGASSISNGKEYLKVSHNDNVDLKIGNKELVIRDGGDTVKVNWGNTKFIAVDDSVRIIRTKRKIKRHWAGVDLGINGFLNSSKGFDLSNDQQQVNIDPTKVTQFMELNYAKSWVFSINFAEWYVPIKKHHFGLVTGLGTEWNNYELKHNVKLNSEGGGFVHNSVNEFNKDYTWGEVDTVFNYSKNRFKTWFVNAPVLLVLNAGKNKNKSFHLSVGAIFGLNLQTKVKYKYRVDGDNKKEKDKQSFNTKPFRVDATIRGGVGWFNIFFKYSLTALFEDGRGPELYPFTAGLTIIDF